jgi:hypothetical protein
VALLEFARLCKRCDLQSRRLGINEADSCHPN